MTDPFGFMGPRGSSRSADEHSEEDSSGRAMGFRHDIGPAQVRDLWVMLDKLNAAADDAVSKSFGGLGRELDEAEVQRIIDEHGFDGALIEGGDISGGRVWELTDRGEHLAFLLESSIYSQRFVLFPRADGVRFP